MSFNQEKLWSLLTRHSLAFLLGGLGLVLIIIGIALIFLGGGREGVIFEGGSETSSDRESSEIFVDVSGAVVSPGVYKLPASSRIQDALIASGGLSASADRDWVAKTLNLAAKLLDGTKIYVPEKSEQLFSNTAMQKSDKNIATWSNGYMVNINTASQRELEALPGIGPVTAGKIIDNRPYADINELLSKKVVGKKVFNQIKSDISVY